MLKQRNQLLMGYSVELEIINAIWYIVIEIFSLWIDRMLEIIVINLFKKKMKPSLLYIKIFFMM